ncbi:HlyC/CorC family transporter [candidate division WOR-3 bacterium]|nr:HlyC/CorC family transporter [candidate division WOR-3 bacterium]
MSSIVKRLKGFFKGKKKPLTVETEEELREIIAQGEENGIITEDEEELITSIFEIGDTPVKEVMVPRIEMVTIKVSSTIEDILKEFRKEGFSKLPCYYKNIDNIVGIVYLDQLLLFWGKREDLRACDIMRFPYFIPESKRVHDTLREFQRKRISIAIVVDEYGGVSGLVTMEDLIEEIVGELQDELDREETLIKEIKKDSYLVNARMELDDFNEIVGTNFDIKDVQTVGGLVVHTMERIPQKGEILVLDSLSIQIIGVSKNRVYRVLVRKTGKVI